ncbi:HalOD1 output domain-containing protein [Halosimplex sp. TS25]|uniref:HalOD1 output domain-containing protein n=1 Tax=Halosimplex rarum TaxID=3396619 RepID=UPI0039E82613
MELTNRAPSHRIVAAIAEEAGVDPGELAPPLADVVDPDALDALLDRSDPDAAVAIRFQYRGSEVVAHADGNVDIQ